MSVQKGIKINKTETKIKQDTWSNKILVCVCVYFFLEGKRIS